MIQKKDEWQFVRERAAQLFEEGDVRAALRLLRQISQEQQRLFLQEEYEQTANC